jgi:hypothetical protein
MFVDVYASTATVGAPEFLLDWCRYRYADNWKKGERFQMFWRDTSSPELGSWWPGTVVDIVPRKPEEDGYMFQGSPWGAVLVRWDDEPEGEPDRVNAWELAELSAESTAARRRARTEARAQEDMERVSLAMEDEFGHDDDEFIDDDEGDEGNEDVYEDDDSGDEEFRPRFKQHRAGGRGRKGPTQHGPHKEPKVPTHGSKSKSKTDRNSFFCYVCGDGGELLECDGTCLRSFHAECLPADHLPSAAGTSDWFCKDCSLGFAVCAACNVKGKAGVDVFKCKMGSCGHSFHNDCLRSLQRVKYSEYGTGHASQPFTCPSHFCAACHMSGDALRMINCWHCIDAWHTCCMPSDVIKLNEKNCKCGSCTRFEGTMQPGSLPLPSLSQPADSSSKHPKPFVPDSTPANPNPPTSTEHDVIQILDSDSEEEQRRYTGRANGRARVGEASTSAVGFLGASSSSSAAMVPPSGCEPRWLKRRLGIEKSACCTDPNPPRIVELLPTGQSIVRELNNKTVFYFGPHKKGGGCDWDVVAPGVKLHSRLDVERIGNNRATTRLMFLHPQRAADTPCLLNGAALTDRERHQLKHGDTISINARQFLYEHPRVPGDEAEARTSSRKREHPRAPGDVAVPSIPITRRIRIRLSNPESC